MIKVSEEVGGYYELEKAVYESNLSVLAKLISIFAEVPKEKALDYIDEQIDSGKTINALYEEIYKGINVKGFFNQKLEVDIQTLPVDMDKLIKEIYEKYMNKEIENQISEASGNM